MMAWPKWLWKWQENPRAGAVSRSSIPTNENETILPYEAEFILVRAYRYLKKDGRESDGLLSGGVCPEEIIERAHKDIVDAIEGADRDLFASMRKRVIDARSSRSN